MQRILVTSDKTAARVHIIPQQGRVTTWTAKCSRCVEWPYNLLKKKTRAAIETVAAAHLERHEIEDRDLPSEGTLIPPMATGGLVNQEGLRIVSDEPKATIIQMPSPPEQPSVPVTGELRVNVAGWTRDALRREAARLEIKGRGSMTKDQLVDAITAEYGKRMEIA